MTFARPEALALLALALPIAALFLVRPRARRTAVGSVLLWRKVQGKRAARAPIAKLEKLLSLLLHTAALAAIVLALAGPLSQGSKPRRIVAVIDASASMGARVPDGARGGTRFEAALALARRLAAALGPEDELGFVLAGKTPRVLGAPEPRAKAPARALDEAALEGGTSDLASALELAYSLAGGTESGPRDREVWLLSDGAAPELAKAPRPRPPEGTRLRYARTGDPGDGSASVVAFSARELPGSPGEVEVAATVASSFRDRVLVSATLSLDGEPVVALEPFALEPGTRQELPARRLALPRGGVLSLAVHAPGDALALDDAAWLVVPGGRRPLVAFAGAEGPAARFVRAALESDEGIELEPPVRAHGHAVPADVVVLASAEVPEEPPTGALLVGEDAARAASGLGAWCLTDRGEALAPRPGVQEPTHPVLRNVLLDQALFARARRIEAGPSWHVLAGDPPLVLAREDAQGRRAVLLPFAPEETDLVLRRAWPLAIANAVRWLAGSGPREALATVRGGEVARVTFPRPLGFERSENELAARGERDRGGEPGAGAAGEPGEGARKPPHRVLDRTVATVFTPSGGRAVVPLEVDGTEASIAFAGTREPGIYTVVAGDRRALPPRGAADARFAVSLLDEAESRIAARPALGLGEEIAPEPRAHDLEVAAPALLAGLAVLLFLVEGYLFHRRGLA